MLGCRCIEYYAQSIASKRFVAISSHPDGQPVMIMSLSQRTLQLTL
jgi:hypothetical protein